MNPLEPPDDTHLQAAQGWLDLGNHIEANEELEEITPQTRAHPDVLQVRWRVYAKAEKWDACLDSATALTKMIPQRRFGWVHRAHALRKLKRTAEAKDVPLWVDHYLRLVGQAGRMIRGEIETKESLPKLK